MSSLCSSRHSTRLPYIPPAPPSIPVRPASPLPPGVPTGPRNQNRYKDRDGNAPAVDGLDYGGTQGAGSVEDDRGNARYVDRSYRLFSEVGV